MLKIMPSFQNNSRRTQTQDFYSSTVTAMDAQDTSDEVTEWKLEEVRSNAKAHPHVKEQSYSPANSEAAIVTEMSGEATTEEKSVAGRKKMAKGGERWDMVTGKEAAMVVDREGGGKVGKEEKTETREQHEIEVELNSILKKGPSKSFLQTGLSIHMVERAYVKLVITVIIFSKTTCPYSRKAKAILLQKYTIVPPPFVVELNDHPLGPGLQSALAKSTGRSTVPNVLINGKSIGGGDDVEALDTKGELVDKIRNMGGKRIMEVKLTT